MGEIRDWDESLIHPSSQKTERGDNHNPSLVSGPYKKNSAKCNACQTTRGCNSRCPLFLLFASNLRFFSLLHAVRAKATHLSEAPQHSPLMCPRLESERVLKMKLLEQEG